MAPAVRPSLPFVVGVFCQGCAGKWAECQQSRINDLRTLPVPLMDDEHLLAEVDDLLRTSPPQSDFIEQENDEVVSWLGRTAAVLKKWDPIQSVGMDRHISALQKRPPPNLPSQDPLNRSAMILENLVLDRHGPSL